MSSAIKGEVVYLYAFDVASEIITERIKEILAERSTSFEIRSDHTIPKDIPLYKPFAIEPAESNMIVNGSVIRPIIHIYDIGVISIAIRVSFQVVNLSDLVSFHNPDCEGKTLTHIARELCAETYENIKDIMISPLAIPEPEAYTVFCITDIENDNVRLDEWMGNNRENIAGLLTESKTGNLSSMQVNEVLRIHRSYSNQDLVIIDWDSALVVDLAGYIDDELYALELANIQLEEYRVMDKKLDFYLNKAYDDIRLKKIHIFGSYSRILSSLRVLRMDIAKLSDEVTNITKFFGDWYLAQIYQDARERFHLNQWRNSVEERLKQLDTIYTVVQNQVSNFRMLWLEVLIVIFFAIDLFAIFFLND